MTTTRAPARRAAYGLGALLALWAAAQLAGAGAAAAAGEHGGGQRQHRAVGASGIDALCSILDRSPHMKIILKSLGRTCPAKLTDPTPSPGPGGGHDGPKAKDDGPSVKDDGPGKKDDGPGKKDGGPGAKGDGPGKKDDGPGSKDGSAHGPATPPPPTTTGPTDTSGAGSKPATGKPATGKPATGKPATGKPASGKSAGTQSAGTQSTRSTTTTSGVAQSAPLAGRADAVRSAARAGATCGSSCVGPVVPRSAVFHDDSCIGTTGQHTGASYTVPSTRGVLYWVNGSDVGAGTYPARDGSTVTVVVSARSGYTLSGVTQWTHTFSDAPTCSRVAADPAANDPDRAGDSAPARPAAAERAADTSQTPALTGVDSAPLLVSALLLLLAGAAACVAGSRRRPALGGVALRADTVQADSADAETDGRPKAAVWSAVGRAASRSTRAYSRWRCPPD